MARDPMRALLVLLLLPAAGCRGTTPERYGLSALGYSAVLVRGRILIPEGETKDGMMWVNLESANERYRLQVTPGETSLHRVEPDVYRVHPTRNTLGFVQPRLRMRIGSRYHYVPFPRDILRKDPVEARPTKVLALGVIEARVLPVQRGRAPRVEVRLDDSIEARRRLIEDMIDRMMDAKAPLDVRDSAVSWTRALEQALVQVQGESERRRTYKIPK